MAWLVAATFQLGETVGAPTVAITARDIGVASTLHTVTDGEGFLGE